MSKLVPTGNPFLDQYKFMQACDQHVTGNDAQYQMYLNLIAEEVQELTDAVTANDRVEQLDALVDILVVTIGAIRSAGFNGEAAWNEVMRTNFAKIDPVTGKVRKREDGKVLKPEGWTPPNLEPFTSMPNE
jgi:predicted HAD superfamily Cof-like phosphohydrolase